MRDQGYCPLRYFHWSMEWLGNPSSRFCPFFLRPAFTGLKLDEEKDKTLYAKNKTITKSFPRKVSAKRIFASIVSLGWSNGRGGRSSKIPGSSGSF